MTARLVISVDWVQDNIAYCINVKRGRLYSSVLVVGYLMPFWWQLFRRWNNRQYRRKLARNMAYAMGEDDSGDLFEQIIAIVLKRTGPGVALS